MGQGSRVHRVLQHVVYVSSWASMIACFLFANPGPYFFITTLETHISVPAPLGQFIPILDVTTNFFHVHAWLLAPGSLLLFLARAVCWRDWTVCGDGSVLDRAGAIVSDLLTDDTWWWAGCSLLLACRAYKSRHICDEVRQSFLRVPGFSRGYFTDEAASLHRLPWYGRCHPFLFNLSPGLVTGLSGGIIVSELDITILASATAADKVTSAASSTSCTEEVEVSIDVSTSLLGDCEPSYLPSPSAPKEGEPLLIDIWTRPLPLQEGEDAAAQKPVLLFLHGGGWLGGFKRMHSSVGLLHNLAARGWLVVSVGYRKQWPLHVDDAFAAYCWVCRHGRGWGADIRRIFVSGGSAGGHLAALLTLRTLQPQPAPSSMCCGLDTCSCKCSGGACDRGVPEMPAVRGVVLFYPAVDVSDQSSSTVAFPAPCPPLDITRGQSMLSWFFEKVVMRVQFGADRDHSSSAWEAGDPFVQLRRHHGASAAASGGEGTGTGGEGQSRFCSRCGKANIGNSFPPTLVVHGELDSIVPVEHSLEWLAALHQLSSAAGGLDCDCAHTGRATALVEVEGGHDMVLGEISGGYGACGNGGAGAALRPGDALVVLRGAKHSFEIAASPVVDVAMQGVIGWLTLEDSKLLV